MKISIKEIASRLTGLSFMGAGASWKPTSTEKEIAKNLVVFLEDRRVLFTPYEFESYHHCVASVIEIRHYITQAMHDLQREGQLYAWMNTLRTSCRKFLNKTDKKQRRSGITEEMELASSLGEMRGVFGIILLMICSEFSISLDIGLGSILPDKNDPTDSEKNGVLR